ncbi:hypothetical protein BJX68DRAFT_261576 [Aspergillus pseudodeflectus]|uniref:Rhodopsin domain-containing protein n=1 Tax=Aspergillus pseudodeflectus TaxID=176178 RepID=A0ABR4LAZ1_9EURO
MPSNNLQESTVNKQRVTTIVLLALALCFLILRLVTRKVKRVPLGLDDWTLNLGMAFVIATGGLNYAGTYHGMGRHMTAVLEEEMNITLLFKILYAFEPVYITAVAIIKFSVLLMYNRIFPVRYIRIGSYILGGITLSWLISVDLVAIFQCTPIGKAWNKLLPGHCIDLKAALIGNGVPNFVTDICILALPVRCIWNLQAGMWQRISIIAVFLSGSFVVFASIYRFSLIFILDIDDIPWTLADAQTWCVVETCAGIISACLPTVIPTLKPLLGHVLGVSFSTNDMSRSKKSNTTNTNNGQSHVLEAGSRVQRSENRDRDRDRDEDMYPLKDISGTGTGTRGSRGSLSSMSGMGAGMGMKGKGQGWTVIEASGDSD